MDENTQSSNNQTDKQNFTNLKENKKETVKNNKALAALSYIWLVSVFVLLFKRDSAFVKFHAKQGLVLALASIILGWIPVLGWFLCLSVFVFAVIGFIKAWQGKYYKLPLVEKITEKMRF